MICRPTKNVTFPLIFYSLQGVHHEIETSHREDLTEEEIMRRLTDTRSVQHRQLKASCDGAGKGVGWVGWDRVEIHRDIGNFVLGYRHVFSFCLFAVEVY